MKTKVLLIVLVVAVLLLHTGDARRRRSWFRRFRRFFRLGRPCKILGNKCHWHGRDVGDVDEAAVYPHIDIPETSAESK